MALERVVITGAGVISPLGHTLEHMVDALLRGESGVRYVPQLEQVGGLRSRIAALVEGVDPKQIPRKFRRSMSRMSMYAYLASQQALQMACYPDDKLSRGRTGVVIGSTLGSTETSEAFLPTTLLITALSVCAQACFFSLWGIPAPPM